MTSETIDRLKQTMKLILDGAVIKLSDFDEIGKHFDTAVQQIERLEKSRDSWKKKYTDLKNRKL